MRTKHLRIAYRHSRNAVIGFLITIILAAYASANLSDENAFGFVSFAVLVPLSGLYLIFQIVEAVHCFRIVRKWDEWDRQALQRPRS